MLSGISQCKVGISFAKIDSCVMVENFAARDKASAYLGLQGFADACDFLNGFAEKLCALPWFH